MNFYNIGRFIGKYSPSYFEKQIGRLLLIKEINTIGSLRGKSIYVLVIFVVENLFLTSLPLPVFANGSNFQVLENDTVTIIIKPMVDDLHAECSSVYSNSFTVGWSPNQTVSSIVYLDPPSDGIYNLTIHFSIKTSWNYTVGVYTDNVNFYSSTEVSYLPSGLCFIRLYTIPSIESPGNYVLTFIITAVARSSSPFNFNFRLPASANGVLFVAVTFLLGYCNVFYFLSLNYRNKKEGISRRQWIIAVSFVAVSLAIIYFMYSQM